MSNNEELDLLVEEAVKKIRARGEKATHRSVRAEVNRKTTDVCKAFKRFREKEQEEEEKRIKNAITPAIRAAILNDREEYAASKTEVLRNEIDDLQTLCELFSEEIAKLETFSDELNKTLEVERNKNHEMINRLEQSNSHQNGLLESVKAENVSLRKELESERRRRQITEKKYSGFCETLSQRSAELKTEKIRANMLQEEAEKERSENKKISTTLEAAKMESERLEGQNSELAAQLEHLRKELSSEIQLRIEAEKRAAVELARSETLQAELKRNRHSPAKKPRSKSKATVSESKIDEGLGF